MENLIKTVLFLFYFSTLLFLVILDIRWDQKNPVPIPVRTEREEGGKRSILVSMLENKKMVFQELEISWENSKKKNVFYKRK
ncbi:hypothetical protein JWG45_08810 [Leptospira sp. 201903070]|uniref:Uncharacterized protein n=1 Tax=Leptospira ainlahdjerensis TaxID=2810033 RepID=A0ABS2UEB2_9LEPT|nr:hypothetical protein [Leptospira ainlahdjerensis]MBM9577250.1 hypothetical protein [Leptospira ainlahdjerensis]